MVITTDATQEQLAGCPRASSTQPWQLAIVADGCGRTHLVALVTDAGAGTRRCVDLLAPVSRDAVEQMRADVMHTLDAEQLATLRGLVQRHVADEQLRSGLARLIAQATGNSVGVLSDVTEEQRS